MADLGAPYAMGVHFLVGSESDAGAAAPSDGRTGVAGVEGKGR